MAEDDRALALLHEVLTQIQEEGELEHLDVDSITPDDDLESLGIDSVARLEIILALEERVGFELIPDPESAVSSIREVIALIEAGEAA